MSSDLSQVTQLVSQDLASPTGHRGDSKETELASPQCHGGIFGPALHIHLPAQFCPEGGED